MVFYLFAPFSHFFLRRIWEIQLLTILTDLACRNLPLFSHVHNNEMTEKHDMFDHYAEKYARSA